MPAEHIHFVTGRLAEASLREVVKQVADAADFDYTIDVLPITVAALMSPEWIARRIAAPPAVHRVLVPGYCYGDLSPIENACGAPVKLGPKDLRQLPAYFNQAPLQSDYGEYDIEIIAEINHCPRLPLDAILQTARELADDGADVIDVGCDPGETWTGIGAAVEALRGEGHRVSIDSFNVKEIESAVRAGTE